MSINFCEGCGFETDVKPYDTTTGERQYLCNFCANTTIGDLKRSQVRHLNWCFNHISKMLQATEKK